MSDIANNYFTLSIITLRLTTSTVQSHFYFLHLSSDSLVYKFLARWIYDIVSIYSVNKQISAVNW